MGVLRGCGAGGPAVRAGGSVQSMGNIRVSGLASFVVVPVSTLSRRMRRMLLTGVLCSVGQDHDAL